MGSTGLISNVTGEAQRQANLLTNTPNLIKVLVEDELDVVVWYKILKNVAPTFDYQVTPYSFDSTTKGKGKANILKFAGSFGKKFIGCVDSDFDWLLENWTQQGSIIKNNKFILQTYAYSIENLASQPYGISDCMLDSVLHSCVLQRTLDKDYSQFIVSISISAYEVLLWHLLMWRNEIDVADIADGWDYIFGNGHYNSILSDHTLSIKEKRIEILNIFRDRAIQRVEYYNHKYSSEIGNREILKEDLSVRYGLSPENAYLYVRGHNLHDFLMHCFIKPVRNELIELHKNEIKSHNDSKDIDNLIRHYTKWLKDFNGLQIMKVDYMDDPSNALTQAFKEAVSRALS